MPDPVRACVPPAAVPILLLAGLCACGGEARPDGGDAGDAAAPASADDPPARPRISILGRGVVSTAAPEFAASVTPDGRTLFFNRASEDRRQLTVMVSERTGDGWGPPRPAPFSGTHRDLDAFVTPDGRRVWFNSDRRAAGDFDIWYVERTRGGWGEPVRPGAPLNSDSAEFFVSTTRHGELYFTSARAGPLRVYRARREGAAWRTPEAVPFDAPASPGNPLVGPDGTYLVFVAAGPDGSPDLWVRCRRDGAWGEAIRLPAPVNSPHADFAPGLDPTDGSLLFTSERPGMAGPRPDSVRPPGDLYRSSVRPAERCRRTGRTGGSP